MHLMPILATLRRHKSAALLIVLEIALTCAIVCNAIFLIGDRLARMDRPSGIVEDELVHVRLTGIGTTQSPMAETTQDLAALRAIPGVKTAASTNMIPFGNSAWNTTVSTIPDDPNGLDAASYFGQGLVDTLGVRLIAGRDFQPDEYVDYDAAQNGTVHVPSVILSRALADRLFPAGNAIGQRVYITGKDPQIVVGVIDRLARPSEVATDHAGTESMILPIKVPFTMGGDYLLRVDPARRGQVLAAVGPTLDKVDPARILLDHRPFAEVRRQHFKQDRAMAYLLAGVSIALLVITALGVVGLASFWVQQRTRHIGIRRALGATRRDILRYFQLENFVLATAGIVVGMALAYGINLWLMSKYQVPRLPAEFLPAGAALLWLLGQLAVLGPALRAASIPPAIATRTV